MKTGAGIAACATTSLLNDAIHAADTPFPEPTVLARYWKPLGNGIVRCEIEPRHCEVGEGETGACGVRENRGGVYYTTVYDLPSAVQVAPVEENFMHVLPGSKALQIGTAGCNLICKFCNTWQISQARPQQTPFRRLTCRQAVEMALQNGCKSVCFTYNEPTVCLEYLVDVASLARKSGLKALCHTAGYINDEPLEELIKAMDAIVVDLKGATKEVYAGLCGVEPTRVFTTAYRVRQSGVPLEIATPLIPGHNDNRAFAETMSRWILQNLGAGVPWQLHRFYPAFQMPNLPVTSMTVLRDFQGFAKSLGLQHVYICNLARAGDTTITCPKCKMRLVERTGDRCEITGLQNGKCVPCGQSISGVWE